MVLRRPEPAGSLAIETSIAKAAPACVSRPLTSVRWLDLQRYMGKWYELARYPNWFQHDCRSDVIAEYYQTGDDVIQMVLSWRAMGGQMRTVKGTARVIDPVTCARLKLNLFKPYSGKYWVIDLGPDYEYAVVGEPERHYLWVLARQPELDARTYQAIMENIRAAGYEPANLKATPQTLRRVPKSVPAACCGVRWNSRR